MLPQNGVPTKPASDELVDEIFEELLPAAGVGGGFALLEHVSFQFFEAGLAGFDLRADAGVPRGVTLFDELRRAVRPCGSRRRF